MTAVSAALLVSLASAAFADTFEDTMRRGFGALLDGRTAPAAQHMQSLLAEHPNSRLARLARADLFAASAHQQTLMEIPGARRKVRVRGLIEEARVRLGHRKPPRGLVPGAILQLSPLHEHALIFDAARSRLYLLANDEGALRPIASHYASAGNGGLGKTDEGDEKTPLGVYHLTSLLDDDKLPELYGTGAYPINYPNRWDQLHGRSGSGIWLHGTPRTVHSRPPKDSRGCIVADNRTIVGLSTYVEIGRTPIVLARQVEWVEPGAWQAKRKQLLNALRQWQEDWQSLDVERYLAHYSREYRSSEHDYRKMVEITRRNARKKTFVEVEVGNLDLFEYPGEEDAVIAVFDQDYRSNNYKLSYRKQQIWKREDNRWRIIFEDRAETG